MGRDENVIIFENTHLLCKENKKLSEAIAASNSAQKLILEKDQISEADKNRYEEQAKVVISKKRSYEAASAYKDMKVAVHNFASASNPGGGVVRGSTAQEECLCRCSTLYFNLDVKEMWDGFYNPHRAAHDPIHNDDIIYTPDVVVFKTDTANPQVMPENEWYKVDVITCAAPNLKPNPTNYFNPGDGNKQAKLNDNELLALHEKRLRRILEVAANNGAEVVILGAFGCGAFQNKPEVVALAAKNVVKDYLHTFKVIEYAVYCGPRDDRNFKVFDRTLKLFAQRTTSL
ncbi:MAG: TIGR02452 family protein [Butyrivibrio sp.]|nr:TIGR02452 family protein [Butyrivibrio sp.]MBR1640931.1 TIGR02452 family protein [Butyrivibrio sp.]